MINDRKNNNPPDRILIDPENINESIIKIIVEELIIFLKGLLKAIPLFALQLIGALIVLPIALVFIKNEQKTLHRWLWMFDNADYQIGRDHSTFDSICERGKWERYKWLAWRNPLNGLGYQLGFEWTKDVVFTRFNEETRNVGNTQDKTPGYKRTDIIVTDPKTGKKTKYQERYWIWVWPWFPNKCIEYRNGYKIGNPGENKPGDYIQIVGRFSFWKSYRGISSPKEITNVSSYVSSIKRR